MMLGQAGAKKNTEQLASEHAGENDRIDRDGTHNAASTAICVIQVAISS